MTPRVSSLIVAVGIVVMSTWTAEAKPKGPQMCGGGCTCEQIIKLKQTNPNAYHQCLDNNMTDPSGRKYYFRCDLGSTPRCCSNSGTVETCDLGKTLTPTQPGPPANMPRR